MKKTVIKRRKRVPAAGPGSGSGSGRMSDQAAAEALVSVGRLQTQDRISGEEGEEESDVEVEQPKKKRTKRSKSDKGVRKEKGKGRGADDDVNMAMAMEEEEEPEEVGGSNARRSAIGGGIERRRLSRDSGAGAPWPEQMQVPMNANEPQALMGEPPRGQSPRQGQEYDGAHRGHPQFMGHSHNTGFELPPLNHALSGAGYGTYHGSMSSYLRSGSTPSRTHSPLSQVTSGQPYMLPPPHSLGLGGHGLGGGHGHQSQFYSSQPGSNQGRGLSGSPPAPTQSGTRSPAPGSTQHLQHQHGGPMGLSGPGSSVPSAMSMGLPMPVSMAMSSNGPVMPVPNMAELEGHYHELREERRRLEDMLEKTDRMLERVRRGVEDMRGAEQVQRQGMGVGAMPTSGSRGEGRRESVWPIVASESATRD